MLTKIISYILIPAFLVQVIGCYSQEIISKEELYKNRDENISVVTNDKKEYIGRPNRWEIQNDTLVLNNYIYSEGFTSQKIPLASIDNIYIKRIGAGTTILIIAGLAAGIILIAASLSSNHRSYVSFPNTMF